MCNNDAAFRSNIRVKKSYTSFYYKGCAKGGLDFGWPEEGKLEELG